jgi:DNA-binding SARP family transcriptional activator
VVAAAPVTSGPVTSGPAAPVPGRKADAVLRLRLLGGSSVSLAGRPLAAADWGYAKPRELLYLFASSPPLTREQIGLALWPELTEGQLRNAMHSALRQLRRTLGDAGWVEFTDGRYALDASRPLECDVRQFERALADARAIRPQPEMLGQLQRALVAYGGDFLAGSTAGDWVATRRAGLRRAYERALSAAGRLLMAAGRLGEAADVYRRAIAHEPLDEAAHRALMECWAASGQGARALRHYEELSARLDTQVGSTPAAQTAALYERLRRPVG